MSCRELNAQINRRDERDICKHQSQFNYWIRRKKQEIK